jgi:hypothetical protein
MAAQAKRARPQQEHRATEGTRQFPTDGVLGGILQNPYDNPQVPHGIFIAHELHKRIEITREVRETGSLAGRGEGKIEPKTENSNREQNRPTHSLGSGGILVLWR